MTDRTPVHEFLTMQRRGVVALPRSLRDRLHLDEPGAQLEVVEHPDGTFDLRGALPVPADQRWFWTERWAADGARRRLTSKSNARSTSGRSTSCWPISSPDPRRAV